MLKPETHLSDQELRSVLTDSKSAELEQRVELHVTDCETCREKLETLAADRKTWNRATSILTEQRIGETVAFLSRFRNRDMNEDVPTAQAGYSVKRLLDPPSHPEMLGRLEHYEIEREIGRGGMGVVLKAHDTELNRAVAIKMMAPHLASHGIARQRFAREARSAAAVLHPNVIAIHAVSTDSKTPWLVMPYIVGPSLEQVVQSEGALDERDLVRFAMQIAAGLAAAHAQGVVHRDIKPANVLIESGGRVVITDFGLARAECDASMTQTGWFAGTPNFMSPEQARGKDIDHRSDLFSLGSVMYFMATGRLPFRGDGPMAVLEQIRDHHPSSPRSVNSRISRTLSNLIERLLAKRPEDRIQSAATTQQILEQYLAHLHHPESRARPVIRPPKRTEVARSRKIAWFASACATVLAGLLIWIVATGSAKPAPVTFDAIVSQYELSRPDDFHAEMLAIERELNQGQKQIATESLMIPGMFGRDQIRIEIQEMEKSIDSLDHEFRW